MRLLVRAAALQEVSQLVKDEIKIQREHDGGNKAEHLHRAHGTGWGKYTTNYPVTSCALLSNLNYI